MHTFFYTVALGSKIRKMWIGIWHGGHFYYNILVFRYNCFKNVDAIKGPSIILAPKYNS